MLTLPFCDTRQHFIKPSLWVLIFLCIFLCLSLPLWLPPFLLLSSLHLFAFPSFTSELFILFIHMASGIIISEILYKSFAVITHTHTQTHTMIQSGLTVIQQLRFWAASRVQLQILTKTLISLNKTSTQRSYLKVCAVLKTWFLNLTSLTRFVHIKPYNYIISKTTSVNCTVCSWHRGKTDMASENLHQNQNTCQHYKKKKTFGFHY